MQEEARRGNWTTVIDLLHAAIDEEKYPNARILFDGFLSKELSIEEFQDLISLECSKLE